MNPIERFFLESYYREHGAVAAWQEFEGAMHCIASYGELRSASLVPIFWENRVLGYLQGFESSSLHALAKHLAPLLLVPDKKQSEALARNLRVLSWLDGARSIEPTLANWIGIYWKESFLLKKRGSKDLLLGPFFGKPTEHLRISLDKGFCGLALSEEKTVNVDDVTKSDRHIACSVYTRSELVIPLKNKRKKYIAELDIDSNQLAAFSHDLQKRLEGYAETFATIL